VSESVHESCCYRCEIYPVTTSLNLVHPDDTVDEEFFCWVPGQARVTSLRFRHGDGYWCYLRAIGNNLLDEPSVGGIVLNFKALVNANALRKDYVIMPFDPLHVPNRTLLWTD